MGLDSVVPGVAPQPAPQKTDQSKPILPQTIKLLAKADVSDVVPLVREDLRARRDAGRKKYGTELHTFNGRDALLDAYQEACDLVVYFVQYREEMLELEGETNFAIENQLAALFEVLTDLRLKLEERKPKQDGPRLIY